MNETIVNNIMKLAKKKGLNLARLEATSKIGNGTIGKWVAGKNNPSLRTLEKVADTLGVSVTYLMRKE